MIQATRQKLIISGHVIEHDYMGSPIVYGNNLKVRRSGPTGEAPLHPERNQHKSAYRAKTTVRRLVNTNAYMWYKLDSTSYMPIFITFTFREDIRDITEANQFFTLAMQRLNYFIFRTKKHLMRYVAVIEFQDKNRNGVIHYHVLFFNIPFINQVYDEVKRIWKYGNINVKSVRNSKNLGTYMTKYMVKTMLDERLKGEKKYFTSRGLKKPRVIYDEHVIDSIIERIPKILQISSNTWENDHCKSITRTIYNLNYRPDVLASFSDLMLQ